MRSCGCRRMHLHIWTIIVTHAHSTRLSAFSFLSFPFIFISLLSNWSALWFTQSVHLLPMCFWTKVPSLNRIRTVLFAFPGLSLKSWNSPILLSVSLIRNADKLQASGGSEKKTKRNEKSICSNAFLIGKSIFSGLTASLMVGAFCCKVASNKPNSLRKSVRSPRVLEENEG